MPTASYIYDENTGRLTSVEDALDKKARYAYTGRGELEKIWGDIVRPTSYTYDEYGSRLTLSTYRFGSGWSGAAWPTATVGTVDTTTWNYEQATGLILNKEY